MPIHESGTLIANRYEVVQGPREKPSLAGGMGLVYLCVDHAEEGRPVALKTFRPELLPDRAARDRFLREGTTWVELGKHPHIVRCHQVFKADIGPEVFFVLELVAAAEGKRDASLRSWLTPDKPLSVEQALLFALHIARGMRHATAKLPELVHRDLKPENLLIGREGLLRVTDFGLATVTRSSTEGGGTFLYMAPEQWDQTNVDLRADIYAFGCILYEMITGKFAVSGKNRRVLEEAHRTGHIGEIPLSLPNSITQFLKKCMAVDREKRYNSWAEVEAEAANVYRIVAGSNVPISINGSQEIRADRVATGWSYIVIGISYADIGKTEIACEYFERTLAIAHNEKELLLEAAGLINLGNSHCKLGDARRAIEFYEKYLVIVREIGDRHREGYALGNLGIAYDQLGNPRRAIEFLERSLAIAREVGDRYREGITLGNLGTAYDHLGDLHQAIEFHERHLAFSRETGNRRGEGNALGNLGSVYRQLGDFHKAIEFHGQALIIAREIGDRHLEGESLGNLGIAFGKLGDIPQAVDFFDKELEIALEIGDHHAEGQALGSLGLAHAALGHSHLAIEFYQRRITNAHKIGDVMGEAETRFNLALLLLKQKHLSDALPHAEYAMKVFTQIGHAEYIVKAKELLNQIQAKLS